MHCIHNAFIYTVLKTNKKRQVNSNAFKHTIRHRHVCSFMVIKHLKERRVLNQTEIFKNGFKSSNTKYQGCDRLRFFWNRVEPVFIFKIFNRAEPDRAGI